MPCVMSLLEERIVFVIYITNYYICKIECPLHNYYYELIFLLFYSSNSLSDFTIVYHLIINNLFNWLIYPTIYIFTLPINICFTC